MSYQLPIDIKEALEKLNKEEIDSITPAIMDVHEKMAHLLETIGIVYPSMNALSLSIVMAIYRSLTGCTLEETLGKPFARLLAKIEEENQKAVQENERASYVLDRITEFVANITSLSNDLYVVTVNINKLMERLLTPDASLPLIEMFRHFTYAFSRLSNKYKAFDARFDSKLSDDLFAKSNVIWKAVAEQSALSWSLYLEYLGKCIREEIETTGHTGDKYKDYLRTPDWKEKVERFAKERGSRCQYDGPHEGDLQGHHTSYANIPHETALDIVIVCEKHHRMLHRRHNNGQQNENATSLP